MIFFCEINKTGEEHVIINNCLLQLLCRAYPNETIQLWIDKKHFANFIDKPVNAQPKYKSILAPEKSNKIRWVLKLIGEIYLINQIIIAAKRHKVPLTFFSSLSPSGNFYLSIIIRLFNHKTRFVVTLHSELELIKKRRSLKLIERIYRNLLRKSLRSERKNRKFLLLNKYIYNNLLKLNIVNEQQLMWIEHPYLFENIRNTRSQAQYPIVFGHFGVGKLSKRSQFFFELAYHMKDYIEVGKARFVMIGQVFGEMAPYLNDYVIYHKSNDLISRQLYDKIASEIHYSVFLYGDDYALISSGSVIDTVAYEKPVIGIKNNALITLFNDSDCKPGYLFDDINIMTRSMENIIRDHNDVYNQLVACIRKKKTFLSVNSQLVLFKQQMDDFILL